MIVSYGCGGFRKRSAPTLVTSWDSFKAAKRLQIFDPYRMSALELEVRVHAGEEYRVFYVARFQDTVYVLHCFQKKTQRTRKADLDVGRQRYRAMMERRKNEGHER